MKYLVLYNFQNKVVGGGATPYRDGVYWQDTQTIMEPFTDLQEATKCAAERRGYVVKLVEITVSEVK